MGTSVLVARRPQKAAALFDNVQRKTSPSRPSPILLNINRAFVCSGVWRIHNAKGDYHCRLTRLHERDSLMQLNKVKFMAVKSSSRTRMMMIATAEMLRVYDLMLMSSESFFHLAAFVKAV